MASQTDSARLMECSSCGNLAIGGGEVTCCASPMDRIGGGPAGPSGPAASGATAERDPTGGRDAIPRTGAVSRDATDGDGAGEEGGSDGTGGSDREAGSAVGEVDLDEVLRVVFGMSPAELDVCLCIMEGGPSTVADLTARVEYERTVVSRHLNHLADLGVLEKRRQILDQGGDVYVYSPVPPAVVRDRFHRSFLRWAAEATARLDDLSRQKVEGIVRSSSNDEWTVFREV
ncbi:MarR family transcriptional regulator [Halobaculum sp. CBA1158]|uniref:helix-turn-helix domain-containing protein n=1 Tax=Halobaculum sp. CBA1158 TaxID=2904243 RepID=UPI001F3A263B|nr:helix-turn-helix domain-containing protein [Halobaculum sp. CBA1158]UIP00950.1 MarR family transcriptional regulator [Halobaculum sp. CBA1158]